MVKKALIAATVIGITVLAIREYPALRRELRILRMSAGPGDRLRGRRRVVHAGDGPEAAVHAQATGSRSTP